MTKRNFLLGKGERLVEDVDVVRGGGIKHHPYTFAQAKQRLMPMIDRTVRRISRLPAAACPDDKAVTTVTLNPEFIAKSYFPSALFNALNLELVGSRPRSITPEKRSRNRPPKKSITTDLFVMGTRSTFRSWSTDLPDWLPHDPGAKQLTMIEQVAAPTANSKIQGTLPRSGDMVFEVVLHGNSKHDQEYVVRQFQSYLETLGLEPNIGRLFHTQGLCFVELDAPVDNAKSIAKFAPVRVLRQMPKLRMIPPRLRASRLPTQTIQLPRKGPVDPAIRVAIFDGGVPKDHSLNAWAKPINPLGSTGTRPNCEWHGVAVTSAFLFGHIDPTKPAARPFAPVDHYRVLDHPINENPHELYEALGRIDRALVENEYDFINVSVGPPVPIEDDHVHAWTAVLDERLSSGKILATIAVGNNGESDAELGLNRILVPADCVNGLSVGACDSPDAHWARCSYSSVGPGRSPGLVKPDLVEFGGSLQRPFIVVSDKGVSQLEPITGTSFSAPSALRLAVGLRAHLGPSLSPLAIRALLIHTTEPCVFSYKEVGRGRIARSVEDIVLCDDDTICVVYQGTIRPSRNIRAKIPVPPTAMPGRVRVTATLCHATGIDPHHSGNYTRAGLAATFRPDSQKRRNPRQIHADARSFFNSTKYGFISEGLRRDAWQWENCLHDVKSFNGSSLRDPIFDIHYNSRLEGHSSTSTEDLAYALVVSVQARNLSNLYDMIVRKYATILEPLQPVLEIPISA